jgi:hypothetical protein
VRGSRWGGDQSDRPRRGRWSQAEVARLQEMYGLKSSEYISKALNRPVASLVKMAETLFPKATRTGGWREAEIRKLKLYLGICEVEIIARIFRRSSADVEAQILELDGFKNDGPWTQEERVEIKRVYGTRSDEDTARVFGRTVESVQKMATELCLAKDKAFVRRVSEKPVATRMPRWSSAEIELLSEMYPECSNLEIAQKLNRSVKSVVSKAHNIGLKKDTKRLQAMGRQNVSLRYGRQEQGGEPAAAESAAPKEMSAGGEPSTPEPLADNPSEEASSGETSELDT